MGTGRGSPAHRLPRLLPSRGRGLPSRPGLPVTAGLSPPGRPWCDEILDDAQAPTGPGPTPPPPRPLRPPSRHSGALPLTRGDHRRRRPIGGGDGGRKAGVSGNVWGAPEAAGGGAPRRQPGELPALPARRGNQVSGVGWPGLARAGGSDGGLCSVGAGAEPVVSCPFCAEGTRHLIVSEPIAWPSASARGLWRRRAVRPPCEAAGVAGRGKGPAFPPSLPAALRAARAVAAASVRTVLGESTPRRSFGSVGRDGASCPRREPLYWGGILGFPRVSGKLG